MTLPSSRDLLLYHCPLSDDEIDASAFCREFGGGGHIRAAGCEITGSLEEVKAKLLKQAEKVLG